MTQPTLSIQSTEDAYPGLTATQRQQQFLSGLQDSSPFERHLAFVESLWGPISDTLYAELLRIHLVKEKA